MHYITAAVKTAIIFMDDLNEMANLHSAGSMGRQNSPFSDLPSHRNETDLTGDFIKKWAVPFYMEIGKYGNEACIEAIKNIKSEITPEVCLLLLGDFNWRTRGVGAYFAAVKGYTDLIDIIGIHLLKSELCCVGHIYTLVLTYFNTPQSIDYLNRFLSYYLTAANLHQDPKIVIEAILYLDKINGTNNYGEQFNKWKLFEEKQKPIEDQTVLALAKYLKTEQGESVANEFLQSVSAEKNKRAANFTTQYFDDQIPILVALNQY
jgi:hypothetical protein